MFCRKCGKEVEETAKICLNCNHHPKNAMNFCQSCGTASTIYTEHCSKCGALLNNVRNIAVTAVINSDFSRLPLYYRTRFKKIYDSHEAYRGGWNWAACIFNFLWAFQKRLWLSGSICLVVSLLSGGIAGVIYGIVYGIRGNYMYYSAYAKEKQLPY